MSIVVLIVKSILVGAILAFPVGPVLLFVIQKTLSEGRRAGMMAGLGSMCVDTLYAGLAMCALGFVSGFIDSYSGWIFLGGGLIVVLVGLDIVRKTSSIHMLKVSGASSGGTGFGNTMQAMGCAFSNPGALFYALALVTFMGLDVSEVEVPVWVLLPCVAAGEILYWTLVTYILTHAVHLKEDTLKKVNRISGIVLALLGAGLMMKGIITLL